MYRARAGEICIDRGTWGCGERKARDRKERIGGRRGGLAESVRGERLISNFIIEVVKRFMFFGWLLLNAAVPQGGGDKSQDEADEYI